MKKLRLELDRLEVQSFVSSDLPVRRGTVGGYGGDTVIPAYCDPNSILVDCPYDPSHNSCGCVTPVE